MRRLSSEKINENESTQICQIGKRKVTREEIDLTIKFMRNYSGFISYYHLILCTMYLFKGKGYKDILEELEAYAYLCDKFELSGKGW